MKNKNKYTKELLEKNLLISVVSFKIFNLISYGIVFQSVDEFS